VPERVPGPKFDELIATSLVVLMIPPVMSVKPVVGLVGDQLEGLVDQ